MFREMGHQDPAALHAMSAAFLPWLRKRLETGEYLAWIAMEDGGPIGGLGLWLMDWPPHMIGPGAPRANILNVYVDPAFRRRGVARSLMAEALDWCRLNGIRAIVLHASQEGRKLYEQLGFAPTNEMRLLLDPSAPR